MAKKKKNSLYLEPTERLAGLTSFDIYSREISKASPSLRKQLLSERKKSVEKITKLEAQKRLGTNLTSEIEKYQKAKQKAEARKLLKSYILEQQIKKRPVQAILEQQALVRQQAQRRQQIIGNVNSRAERIEIWATSLNEIPLLHAMEYERARRCTPPNNFLIKTENDVARSFPD